MPPARWTEPSAHTTARRSPFPPIIPVTTSPEVFIDLTENSVLPNAKQPEKWEGVTIGPRLRNGAHLILTGNDNDYSVTQQAGTNVQFDVYVDFNGGSVQRDLDQPTMLNGLSWARCRPASCSCRGCCTPTGPPPAISRAT
jgi:hypothetical protein